MNDKQKTVDREMNPYGIGSSVEPWGEDGSKGPQANYPEQETYRTNSMFMKSVQGTSVCL